MLRIVVGSVVALGLMASFAQAQPAQFDLKCVGYLKQGGRYTPWSEHYRVDLTRGASCAKACDHVGAAVETGDQLIVTDWQGRAAYMNRDNGDLISDAPQGRITGRCANWPFSGLPKPMF